MGGATPAPTAPGGRKALDAAMNLVPFIDLLSCCISFLLITAVWTQVSTLEVSPSPAGGVQEEQRPAMSALRLTLVVDESGYLLSRSTGQHEAIPRRDGALDRLKLAALLRGARGEQAELRDLEIRAADAIAYDEIVGTMDTALGERFVGLTLNGRDDL